MLSHITEKQLTVKDRQMIFGYYLSHYTLVYYLYNYIFNNLILGCESQIGYKHLILESYYGSWNDRSVTWGIHSFPFYHR